MKAFLAFLILLPTSLLANECPWVNLKGKDLLAFDSDKSYDRTLSAEEARADLHCLELLLKDHYAAGLRYDQQSFSNGIGKIKATIKQTSSSELAGRIFALHQGFIDLHLAYALGDQKFHMTSKSSQEVTLDVDTPENKIQESSEFIYFRPGPLTTWHPSFDEILRLLKNKDKKLVLDLRGNHGGSDVFPFKLAEALFTPDQKIPVNTRRQISSPLISIGMSITLYVMNYDEADEYRAEVVKQVSNLSFEDLVSIRIEDERNELLGTRDTPFNSKIVLLTDSGCASSCETIVEKLSAHPKVRILGANTAGALHFSNAMTIMLPYSGIIAKVPTLYQQYENDAPEGIGYKPHRELTEIELSKIFSY